METSVFLNQFVILSYSIEDTRKSKKKKTQQSFNPPNSTIIQEQLYANFLWKPEWGLD